MDLAESTGSKRLGHPPAPLTTPPRLEAELRSNLLPVTVAFASLMEIFTNSGRHIARVAHGPMHKDTGLRGCDQQTQKKLSQQKALPPE